MSMLRLLTLIVLLGVAVSCSNSARDTKTGATNQVDRSVPALTEASKKLPLNSIKLPAGFSISVFAEVEDARSMALSPSGLLFVGNRDGNSVFAVRDTDGDGVADKKWTIATGLKSPNGVAFKDGDLYVAEISRITKYPAIEDSINATNQKPVIINDGFPTDTHHGWKYIAFGPDGKLYVPVGAPCNICEPKDSIYASITRMNPDGSGREIFARGIRNTVGFTWNPTTKDIWFTDNGRDELGDDVPPCELNTAPTAGLHFGYPYCHGGTIKDPEFGNKRPCSDFVKPAQNFGAHVAPLGLKFNTGSMFPATYANQLFVAQHGSWNRSKKSGYQLVLVSMENGKAKETTPFATGWLNEGSQEVWGRPVDVLFLPDGSMLVSDDKAGVIYRITYKA